MINLDLTKEELDFLLSLSRLALEQCEILQCSKERKEFIEDLIWKLEIEL